MCVQRFDDSLILQFALRIAFRCVLHRRKSQDIRCRKLYFINFYLWLPSGAHKIVVLEVVD